MKHTKVITPKSRLKSVLSKMPFPKDRQMITTKHDIAVERKARNSLRCRITTHACYDYEATIGRSLETKCARSSGVNQIAQAAATDNVIVIVLTPTHRKR